MFHRLISISEELGVFLSTFHPAPDGGSNELYVERHEGKNLILLPKTRGLRDTGRALFGLRTDLMGLFRNVMALPTASLVALEELASEVVDTTASVAGLRIGSGGRRKLTMAFADGRGPLAIVQVPLVELAEDSMAHQARTMAVLRQSDELACHLPNVISEIDLGEKKGTVFSPGPLGRVRGLDNDVVSFLASLHAATSHSWTISESGLLASWIQRLEAWRASLGSSKSSALETAIHLVQDGIDGMAIDHTIAHGDFTRWNLRKGRDGLFVFDWEASVHKSLPYHDLFHFVAAESALLRRPSPTSVFRWRSLRRAAERIAPSWVALQYPLYVAYLVETTLWYTSSREWHVQDQSGPFWRFLWAELARATNASRLTGGSSA